MENGKNHFTGCVVVAAGKATRMGNNINKQYISVGGKPVLARTLSVFEDCSSIDGITLVVNRNDWQKCEAIIKEYGFNKVAAMVEGGDTRQRSVYNGLCAMDDGCGIVLVHDGARPFVDRDIVERCINAARQYQACCAAVPVKDTIKVTDRECFARETPDRSRLWAVQTPQAFDYRLILKAHQKALEDGFTGTDDAVLAERMGIKIKLVMGSYYNIKITTNEDLIFAETIAGLFQ